MFQLWGKRKPPSGEKRIRALQGAQLRNRTTEAALARRVEALRHQIANDTTRAQQAAASHPQVARSLLERRAAAIAQETLLARQLAAVRQRSMQIEMAISTTQVVQSAAETHSALMSTRNPDAADRVSELMDEVGELMDEEEEIAESVGATYATGAADIDTELAAMQASALPSIGASTMPDPVLDPVLDARQPQEEANLEKVNVDTLIAWENALY